MSAALSSYLAELLAASACHEIVFVHDNCAGPKESNANSSGSSSSLLENSLNVVDLDGRGSFTPELSRWDSSSSLTLALTASRNRASSTVPANSSNNVTCKTPQIHAVIAAPQPPRRQTSWEGPVATATATASSESSSFRDFDINNTAHSRISCSSDPTDLNGRWRRHQQQQQQVHCALPPPPTRSQDDERDDEKVTNSAPRPPPRRTSSRLRRSILRTLETRLDRFPNEEETADNFTTTTTTLASLASRALLRTSTELEFNRNNTRMVLRRDKLQAPALSAVPSESRRQTSQFGMLMMDLKNESNMDLESPSGASVLDDTPSKLSATCTSKTKHHQGQDALNYGICPCPPRKPQRQGTPEMEVKKMGRHDATSKRSPSSSSSSSSASSSLPEKGTKRSNSNKVVVCRDRDSLQDLIRLRRPGAKPHSL